MNTVFGIICLLSLAVLTVKNPNGALAAATDGATKAVTLCFTLTVIYTVWSGFLQVAESAGLCDKLAKILKKPLKLLFPKADEQTRKYIATNVSANLLGMSGVATPPAIAATKLMTDAKDHDGATTLFVLASTSIQLLPSTVISLRQAAGSNSPADIFLPTLISTVISTLCGLLLCKIFQKSHYDFSRNSRSASRAVRLRKR